MSSTQAVAPLAIVGPTRPQHDHILTPQALEFVGELTRRFAPRIAELLAARNERQQAIELGATLDFLPETAMVRNSDWQVAPLPADLWDRRVEITGPIERKMIINALNSGANVFMADFEDSNSPTWSNVVEGQIHLYDAVRRTISFTHPTTAKHYTLNPTVATLLVRPRGLHLFEKHVQWQERACPAALFDFGLYVFHNAQELVSRGTGPYFYLPKLESHLEARLWNDVFTFAQEHLGIPHGTIKATVLIETLPAAFEMDEILYELREHSAGLNCGRWDYIFSFIKTLAHDSSKVLPDRAQVGMTQHCMRAYTQLLIKTCHRRGVHAMGGMAAQIPIKGDPKANAEAIAKVKVDKQREAQDGHDGTWVAHPGLVPVAKAVFDQHMAGPNQLDRLREDVNVTAADLLQTPTGTRTLVGLHHNIRVGLQYLHAWLQGNGCVPLYHLMEDAATAEISRTQIWQWLHHSAALEDGTIVDHDMVAEGLKQVLAGLSVLDPNADYAAAAKLFMQVCTKAPLVGFLTLPAYDQITTIVA